MLHQLYSILAFCCIALASFGLGRVILRGLAVGQEDRLSVVVWSMGLGLIAAGSLLLALGLLGLLYVPLIGVLSMAGCFWGLSEVFRLGPAAASDAGAPWPEPNRYLRCGILVAAAAACFGSLLGALAPPVAGDALCYHLELPKVFLAEHRIGELPYHDNATFPLLTEMWFLWGLAIDGGVCAQLVHWGLGLLLALATVVLGGPILGRQWAWIAGCVVVLTPGVNNQMTAPLNDVALAAMTTLALAAWHRAVLQGESRRWFVVAGLAAGGALAVKYVAVIFAAAVAGTWLWRLARLRPQRRLLLEGAAVVAVVALSVGGPWYARAAWYRGNPIYPLLGEVFSPAAPGAVDGRPTLPGSKSPLGRSPTTLLAAPWHLTMHPERFGGRGHQLGVMLFAAVPGVVLCRRLRGLGTLLAVASCYFILWFLLRQNVRFLFALVPLLAVATVWVWIELGRFPPAARWVCIAAFALVVAAMAVVPLRRSRHQVAAALGIEDRASYLLRHEPTWPAAALANAVLGADAHILSQDYRAFYFDCRVTRENAYRRLTRYDRQIQSPGDFSRLLRAAGFTHLLLAENCAGRGVTYDPVLSRLADASTPPPPANWPR